MIDWDRVAELRKEVGEKDFNEVVELFLEEVDEMVTKLKCAPDPACLEEDMHFLKGSSLNLGFRALSSICQRSEKLAAAGQPELVDLLKVFTTYEASKAEFLKSAGVGFAA